MSQELLRNSYTPVDGGQLQWFGICDMTRSPGWTDNQGMDVQSAAVADSVQDGHRLRPDNDRQSHKYERHSTIESTRPSSRFAK